MRGKTELGGKATPGTMEASMMKRRPFRGSWTTCSFSTTVPRLRVSPPPIGGLPTPCPPFLQASNGEIEIDARLLTRREANALAAHGFEASELDIEAVLARCQAGHRVHAGAGPHN